MKRFLLGIIVGLVLGWVTVPFLVASFSISQSDGATGGFVSDDEPNIRTYKDYLKQMLKEIREVNTHLKNVEANTFAVKEKLKA